MRFRILLFSLQFLAFSGICQKPLINNDTYKTWTDQIGNDPKISNDGKYLAYSYALASVRTLVIESTDGKFKKEFQYADKPEFTTDSKFLIFESPEGVGLFQTTSHNIKYLKDANEYIIPENGVERWIAYRKGDNLLLYDFKLKKEKMFPDTEVGYFNSNGTVFLSKGKNSLTWLSLNDMKSKTIQQGLPSNHIIFDNSGTKLAFITTDANGIDELRYYTSGMDSARVQTKKNTVDLKVSPETPRFSKDGERIFFRLMRQEKTPVRDSNIVTRKVDIWHYKDQYLMSQQLEDPSLRKTSCLAVVSIKDGKVIKLETPDSSATQGAWKSDNKYVIVNNNVNSFESYWNTQHVKRYDLISTIDGSRKRIPVTPSVFISDPELSLNEHFIVWYEPDKKAYFSYELSTGVVRNITNGINVPLNNIEGSTILGFNLSYRIAGWLQDDQAVLIYDQYDIWEVDPLARRKPINITGGFGREHHTVLRMSQGASGYYTLPLKVGEIVLLSAFNEDNKYNGFYKKQIGKIGVKTGDIYPAYFYFTKYQGSPRPLKAKNAEVYLVKRQTASEAPNLFLTADFKTFRRLTDIQPQHRYNWLTSELITWTTLDNKVSQGILYKPENFDPSKKYPVIFRYYESFSHEVYMFRNPVSPSSGIDIPWYVSNGYLVFVPDIQYTQGHTGQSVVNSVVSAANCLLKYPWVDPKKLGLQGHSFGGYETNYLVANTNIFACAQEGAGMTDLLSWCGGIGFQGKHLLYFAETFQTRLGTTPWERPDIYIENSPVFKVNKVTTPLLMMHNKKDDAVPFAQAIEMFTALRRLKKPVWLLQYDGMGHNLGDEQAEDFNIRRQQFFAHYLKDAPAPKWMTEGIPASEKGFKSGLELDASNKKP